MGNNNKDKIRRQVDLLGIPPKEMVKKEIARHERKDSYKKLLRGILIGLVATVAVIIVITNTWLAVLQIDGSSMNPLLQRDEIVIAVRDDNPVPNDVIAFYRNNTLYVKRVIAVGGDTVKIDDKGNVSVNNHPLYEPYVTKKSLEQCDITFPFTVPAGTFFVLGDNRPISQDSRDSRFGTISREQIVGKIKFTIWPLSRFGSTRSP